MYSLQSSSLFYKIDAKSQKNTKQYSGNGFVKQGPTKNYLKGVWFLNPWSNKILMQIRSITRMKLLLGNLGLGNALSTCVLVIRQKQ
jgi:hypothetical protein